MVPGIFSPVSSFSHLLLAAYWSGVKLWISISRGQTKIPAGCCPVVRFTPATPADNFSIKISLNVSPRFSAYRLTNPKAVLSWIPAIVPARNTLSRPKSSSVYLWATAWSSPEEKFRSISGTLSPSNPRKTANGILCPSLFNSVPQLGHFLSARSKPPPTEPSVKNWFQWQWGHT